MGIILWIIFGALVGWAASLIMKTYPPRGVLVNIIIGITGAVLGGWIMNLLGKSAITGFNFYSFLVSLLGAIVLIVLIKLLKYI